MECRGCSDIVKLEEQISSIKEKIDELNDTRRYDLKNIDEDQKQIIISLEVKLKELKESFDNSIVKLGEDVKTLFSDYYSLRENVLDIKNTVENATSKTNIKIDQLTEQFKNYIGIRKERRKSRKNNFIYPAIIGVIVTIINVLISIYM